MNCDLPEWDLSDIYLDNNMADLAIINLEKDSLLFSGKYKDKILDLGYEDFLEAIKEYETFSKEISKIVAFAYLPYLKNTNDQKSAIRYSNIVEKTTIICNNIMFFPLAINKMPESKLQVIYKNIGHYQYWFDIMLLSKPHQLSDDLELLMNDKGVVANDAWVRLHQKKIGELNFTVDNKDLNMQQLLNCFFSSDKEIRQQAMCSMGQTLSANSEFFATILNNIIRNKQIDDKWRHYQSDMASMNLYNRVDGLAIETMVQAVKDSYPKISHRYYKIKAKLLGNEFIDYCDRSAPVYDLTEKISWNDAKLLVMQAYKDFSPEMGKIAQMFFDNNWIDAKVVDGKYSGAFMYPCYPHPYVLLNYFDNTRDVMTLAHELGHAIHQYLSNKNGELLNKSPLPLSETASIFGEMLAFEVILSNCNNKKEKISILIKKIEDMIATIIRQVAFHDFEIQVHKSRKNGELTVLQINHIWETSQKESLGPYVVNFDENFGHWWGYVSHFFQSPFYVHSYAFANCLVNSIYQIYKDSSIEKFEEKYIKLLENSSKENYDQLLEPFGLSITDINFWKSGIDIMSNYIDQLESQLLED